VLVVGVDDEHGDDGDVGLGAAERKVEVADDLTGFLPADALHLKNVLGSAAEDEAFIDEVYDFLLFDEVKGLVPGLDVVAGIVDIAQAAGFAEDDVLDEEAGGLPRGGEAGHSGLPLLVFFTFF
jgi:hypothetical protein